MTTIERDRTFYSAESYHQDYMIRHPRDPYIMINDLPKVEDMAAALGFDAPAILTERPVSEEMLPLEEEPEST